MKCHVNNLNQARNDIACRLASGKIINEILTQRKKNLSFSLEIECRIHEYNIIIV